MKQLILFFILILFVIIFDILFRLNATDKSKNKAWKTKQIDKVSYRQLTSKRAGEISAGIEKYDVDTNLDKKNVSDSLMPMKDQLMQKGVLSQLYSGNMRYRLFGIFKQTDAFAVIERENLLTNDKDIIKVKEREFLNHYRIKNISSNRTLLISKDNTQVTLRLYKNNIQK